MRNCNGFTLVEVLISFLLLVAVCMTTLPVLSVIYQERLTIEEERRHLRLLRETVSYYSIGKEVDLSLEDIRISVKYSGVATFCKEWTGRNGRSYEYCFLGSN